MKIVIYIITVIFVFVFSYWLFGEAIEFLGIFTEHTREKDDDDSKDDDELEDEN